MNRDLKLYLLGLYVGFWLGASITLMILAFLR